MRRRAPLVPVLLPFGAGTAGPGDDDDDDEVPVGDPPDDDEGGDWDEDDEDDDEEPLRAMLHCVAASPRMAHRGTMASSQPVPA